MNDTVYLALLGLIGGSVGVLYKQKLASDKEFAAQIKDLMGKESECRVLQAKAQGEIDGLHREMDWLRKDAGNFNESMSPLAWVVADFTGKILDYGGRLLSMLKYDDTELIGKNIEMLIANEGNVRERHHAGLEGVRKTGEVRGKAILGKALTSEGKTVDVAVLLSKAEHKGVAVVRAILVELTAQPFDPRHDRRRNGV